jgi:hypothetical protein
LHNIFQGLKRFKPTPVGKASGILLKSNTHLAAFVFNQLNLNQQKSFIDAESTTDIHPAWQLTTETDRITIIYVP